MLGKHSLFFNFNVLDKQQMKIRPFIPFAMGCITNVVPRNSQSVNEVVFFLTES